MILGREFTRMPWNDNSGGGGSGGPWGNGSGGGNRNNNNPWGRPGGQGNGGGGNNQEPPDLDELVERMQASIARMFGGGKGRRPGGASNDGGGGKGSSLIGTLIIAGIVGFAVIVWPGRAVYQVEPSEAGVVMRFGNYVRTTPSGLHVKLPWPIETVELPEVTTTHEIPIGNNRAESEMLTRDENIVDIAFTVQWRVDLSYPDGVRDFLFNVRDPEDTVRAVAESAIREVVGTSDLQPIITTARAEVSQRTRELMQTTLDEYEAGIQVLQVNLQRAQAPQSVIDAFRDVDAAAQDAESARLAATATANRLIPAARGEAARMIQEAEAYRDSRVAEAQGDADRFVAIYEQYAAAPEVTRRRMFLETMELVIGRSELIILDGDGGAVPYLPLDQLGNQRTGRGGNQ